MKKMQILVAIALSIPMVAMAQEVPSLEKVQAACRALRPDVQTSEAAAQRKNCELEAEMIVLKAQLAKAPKPVPVSTPLDAAMMARLERDVAALKAEKKIVVEKKQEPEKPAPVVRPQPRYGMGMPMMIPSGLPVGTIVPKFGSDMAATWVIPGMVSYIGVEDIISGVLEHERVAPGEMRVIVRKHGQAINVALPGAGNMPVSFMPVLAQIDTGSPKLYQGGFDPYTSSNVYVSALRGEEIELVILITEFNYQTATGQMPLWRPFLKLRYKHDNPPGSPRILQGSRGTKVWR